MALRSVLVFWGLYMTLNCVLGLDLTASSYGIPPSPQVKTVYEGYRASANFAPPKAGKNAPASVPSTRLLADAGSYLSREREECASRSMALLNVFIALPLAERRFR